MISTDSSDFLARLLDAPGPSGFELPAARVWRTEAESLAHRVVELAGGMTVAPARRAPGVPPAEMPVSPTQEREASSPSRPEASHVA